MNSEASFKVGDWLVEPELDRVSQGPVTRNLRPKVMELLMYLANRPGQVASSEEILDDLWAGKIVTDSSVYRCIGELREALAGDEGRQEYIDTIPKKGYRLIAPVEGLDEVSEPVGSKRKTTWILALVAASFLVTGITFWVPARHSADPAVAEIDRKSVAVLPLENISGSPDHAYIADGIHNDLLTQLAKIDGLKVISRTSVLEYRDSDKKIREIGRELAVAAILEGSVQRAGSRVRVNVQLIDTETDDHLWAEAYDRDFTAENVLSIQRRITTAIAAALRATLSPEAEARISEIPTSNTLAYEFYLSGNEYFEDTDSRKFIPFAVEQYQRAVAEDPEFTEAWAALARAHTAMYGDRFLDRTASRLEMASEALGRALALSPTSPEAFFASGVYHHAIGAYDKALSDFDRAEKGVPGDSRIFWRRATLLERAGRWDESIAAWRRAVELDPRNVSILEGQAWTYIFLRDYEQAERIHDRVLELRPDLSEVYFMRKAVIPFMRDGDFAAVLSALEDPLVESLDEELRHYFGWIAAFYKRDYRAAVRYLEGWDAGDDGRLFNYLYKESFLGTTYRLAGQRELAERNFREVLLLSDEALADIEGGPQSAVPEKHAIFLTSRAEALAGLGRYEEAGTLALRAIEIMPESKDAVWSSIIRSGAIYKVLVALPDHDAAIEQLDIYFSRPGRNSIERTLADPRVDPIRDDSRFLALVEKYKRR